MKKGFLLFISLFLFARENPFVPIVNINNPSPIEEIKELQKIAFNVPSDARILNKIKLIYTNVDGTLKEYEIDVNQGLDWHKVYMMLDARELSIKEDKEQKTELKVEDKIKLALNKEEEKEQPIKTPEIVEEVKQYKPLEYTFSNDFNVILDKKNIHIKTHNNLLREFSLKNPNRIVMDFKTNYVLQNKHFKMEADYVDEIYSGVHRNFYRLVIKLDGIYDYDIQKNVGEYIIKLK
ncbi:AMIN domain-containing protein [Campylobacter sp. RM5004]|uniref:AMIN domain-containing protein n=1 Tax=Campylobacter sp. RM5004 TaxID=1660078 RepID=UPI001EFA67B2|nr:AMIN domain-containing protein [Campylobacter sp. RM5004]ULO01539.1 AMIN domain-containing protein [Campylobacter sp. RM5004]